MKIGIDISQIAYEKSGVGNFLKNWIEQLLRNDKKNEYILFYSSLRKPFNFSYLLSLHPRVKLMQYKFPPLLLDFLWNVLHLLPIEWLIGKVDIFISSDWTEPPSTHAKKATILYDLIVYAYPKETDARIVATQKRRLQWVKKESDAIFCISQASKHDAIKILGIEEKRLHVIYPGIQ